MMAQENKRALVSSCNRTPMPKFRARPVTERPAEGGDGDDEKQFQVPKVVVDLEEMSAPTIEQVIVRVYDLGPDHIAHWKEHGKTYSTFHSAVEVLGREYSFGMPLGNYPAEVICTDPGRHPDHKLRATLPMGYTSCPPRDVLRLIEGMKKEWNRSTYSVSAWNCHHFSETLCRHLGVTRLPDWVNSAPVVPGGRKVERVFISVYDLGQTFVTRWHNMMVKSYGIFHTGVVVYGLEWSFGMTEGASTTGVGWNPPTECPDHSFRETLSMGCTGYTQDQVDKILRELMIEWPGNSYDVFKRNCHNFSATLCERLGVGRPPAWVNELASSLAPKDDALADEIIVNGAILDR